MIPPAQHARMQAPAMIPPAQHGRMQVIICFQKFKIPNNISILEAGKTKKNRLLIYFDFVAQNV